MIVKTLAQTENTERHVKTENWDSVRLLLSSDNMGFSFHITTIREGAELTLQYLNHLESVYCMSGEGSIKDLASGDVHAIKPGTIYALDKHDRHILSAVTELKLACVFNPPITGQEVHDEKGSYPPASS